MSLAAVLPLIRCPATRLPLIPLSGEEIARLRQAIGDGQIKNRAGEKVAELPLEAVRNADTSWIYLVKHGAVNLLADEALPGAVLNVDR